MVESDKKAINILVKHLIKNEIGFRYEDGSGDYIDHDSEVFHAIVDAMNEFKLEGE